MNESTEQKNKIQKQPSRRKLRLSTIIIWAVFIIVVVLCFRVGTQSQRINKELILITAADELGKNTDELTKSDYLNLKELDLSSSMITDIGLLKKFPNLQKLDLSKTPMEITSAPKWKIMLERLRFIKISTRKKIDLSPLRKLHNLETLILSETNFQSLKPIANLKNLRELDLRFTEISDLEHLKKLTNLRHLNIGFTEVSDLRPIKDLTNLQTLEIINTFVSDLEPIKGLTNLETLNLRANGIIDLEPIKSLKNLQSLDIIACPYINIVQKEDLQKALPNLMIMTRYGMGN